MLKADVCAAVFVTFPKSLSLFRTDSIMHAHFSLACSLPLPFVWLGISAQDAAHLWLASFSLSLYLSSPIVSTLFPSCLRLTSNAWTDVWVGVGTYRQLPGNRLVHHFIKAQNSLHGNHTQLTSLTQRTHPGKGETTGSDSGLKDKNEYILYQPLCYSVVVLQLVR